MLKLLLLLLKDFFHQNTKSMELVTTLPEDSNFEEKIIHDPTACDVNVFTPDIERAAFRPENLDQTLINYRDSYITVPFTARGMKLYAIVTEMHYHEEGSLFPTAQFSVVLLHPRWGTCIFDLQKDEDEEGDVQWMTEDINPAIDHSFVERLGAEIDQWKNSENGNV